MYQFEQGGPCRASQPHQRLFIAAGVDREGKHCPGKEDNFSIMTLRRCARPKSVQCTLDGLSRLIGILSRQEPTGTWNNARYIPTSVLLQRAWIRMARSIRASMTTSPASGQQRRNNLLDQSVQCPPLQPIKVYQRW
jgi:hypothetical protein